MVLVCKKCGMEVESKYWLHGKVFCSEHWHEIIKFIEVWSSSGSLVPLRPPLQCVCGSDMMCVSVTFDNMESEFRCKCGNIATLRFNWTTEK